MRIRTILLLLLTAGTPLTTQAQARSSQSGDATAQASQARIDAALRTAAQADIPVSLLESKVAEGRAKNVPVERIAAAVEARLDALVRASDLLEQGNVQARNAGELAVVADGIQVGVDDGLLLRVMRSSPADQRAVATAVVTQLIQLGYESEPALLRVNNALSAGPAALANLQAELSAMLRIR